MKIKVIVNLGNYENIGVESSEFDNSNDCYFEIREALLKIRESRIDEFITKYISPILF